MKKLILVLSAILVLTFCGCSNDTATTNDALTSHSSTSKTLPVVGFTFSCQADFIDVVSPGCFHVAIRVYMTDTASGQVTLVASGESNVGSCNRVADNGCLGEYKGDYIIKDDYVGGQCIKELFRDNPNIYSLYVTARNHATAGH